MMRTGTFLPIAVLAVATFGRAAPAQDRGSVNPAPLPPVANPADPKLAAKELFGRRTTPLPMAARAIGFYTKGCLAGGIALPVNGKTWQVMRLSRNRNFGHPNLIKFLENFAAKAPKAGWPGILVGDLAQARGGPMLTGHASHQVGLDADIWLTPMPTRELTRLEREEMSAINVVRADKRDIDHAVWTPQHTAIIRAAAESPEVERVLVNAAIKKALCREASGNRSWLRKVRPWWGHNYHMHIRVGCPADSPECKSQDPAPDSEGCGKELDYWFQESILNPPPPREPSKPRPPLTLADLPPACRNIALTP